MDEYLETQWEKLQQAEKALLANYRTLDERYKNTNAGSVRQRRDAALAELENQWRRITEFAEAHPEFSERWDEWAP
ncbi:MAG TPA: hypothetical protein VI653_08455 [Steroidobacteraceae bacterium]